MRVTGQCFLPEEVIQQLIAEAERWPHQETGGILLGVADDRDVWVDLAIGPGPDARRGRTWFIPDAQYHEQEIAKAYKEFGRRIMYLGDWHTHPGASVHLSWRDFRTLRSISNEVRARQPTPLMVVLGEGTPWEIGVWRYDLPIWYKLFGGATMLEVVIT